MNKFEFFPATGGSILFPSYDMARDYFRTVYPGSIIHGTSVNDGKAEFGKVYAR